MEDQTPAEVRLVKARRRFIQALAAGTTVVTLGGIAYVISDLVGTDEVLPDGRRRLPPGQRALVEKPDDATAPIVEAPPQPKVIRVDATTKGRDRIPPGQFERHNLKPMGGAPGNPSREAFRLKVHGEVEQEMEFTFEELLDFTQIEQTCDVHCVTTWSLLGAEWKGVRVSDIAEKVKPTKRARFVIFEAAHEYTANIDIEEAMKPNVLVSYQVNGQPLAQPFGAPVRSLVPDRYFWKSAKYLTGIRFVEYDMRGYWETRGYHNHADPWKSERYSSQERG